MSRVDLTPEQVAVLKPLWHAKRQADQAWTDAMALLGVDPAKIVSGELDSDPHLIVRDDTVSA